MVTECRLVNPQGKVKGWGKWEFGKMQKEWIRNGKLFEVMDTLIILIMVIVSWLYTHGTFYSIVHFKDVQSIIC